MRNTAEFYHGTNRNTQAYRVLLRGSERDELELFISYNTIIAVYHRTGDSIRRARLEAYSRTTSRHMTEMGVRNYDVVGSDEIQALIREAITNIGLSYLPVLWGDAAKQAA